MKNHRDRTGIARKWSDEQLEYLRKHAKYTSAAQMAKALDLPPSTVDTQLVRLGLRTRKTHVSDKPSREEFKAEEAAINMKKIAKLKKILKINDMVHGYQVVALNTNIVTLSLGNYRQSYDWNEILQSLEGKMKLTKEKDEE